MQDQQRQYSLKILARIQAVLGGVIGLLIGGLYISSPELFSSSGLTLASAALGLITVIYFGTLHQWLARKHQAGSTLIISSISVANIVLIVATTGYFNSPYYALWLLAIVAAGIIGKRESLVMLSATLLAFVYAFWVAFTNGGSITIDMVIVLSITLAAGGLAYWISGRTQHANVQSTKLETLSGQLTQEQLKSQALVSSIGEGVMVINSERKIQLFNIAAQQLTGWDESSAMNLDYNLVLQLRDAEDHELTELNNPFDQAWTTKTQVVKDNIITTTKAGRKITLSLSISPIYDQSGTTTGVIALFRDISQQKEAARQKDEFVSTASHEMRTPVAAIEGYISLAMNPNVATIDDRARKYLEKAHDTIQHLGELFRDLLSATKAEEGKLNTRTEVINISELMQKAVDDMQFTAQKKQLTVVFQVSNLSGGKAIAPIYYVAANTERLREVVMNLIDNAIKFTPQGGITVQLSGNDKEVQVDVTDTGVGIAAEDMAHLFQKFYRIDNSATRTIGGTGLGLYLCRTVIELFSGRIWVTSEPGKGSTFHFTLPRLSAEQASRLQQEYQQPTTPGQTPVAAATPSAGSATPTTAVAATPAIPDTPTVVLSPVAMPIPGETTNPVATTTK